MYGYIRPDIGELRINEYRRFRSAYCGLCETLKRRYGIPARFLISYDMTFLAILTLPPDIASEKCRCPMHPFRTQSCVCAAAELSDAADATVILAYRKMQDDASDERGSRALLGRIGAFLLRRSYRKAAARLHEFNDNARACLDRLSAIEKGGTSSLDEAADCFARLLAFPTRASADETQCRIQREILYHVGRVVYILDAVDDYTSDRKRGRYNPLCRRFLGETMSQEEKSEIRATLNLSLWRAMHSSSLLPESVWKPILDNILSRGLPSTADAVFAGTWKKKKKAGNLRTAAQGEYA